eukprot:252296-Prorocentrum_minimum.AAC.2
MLLAEYALVAALWALDACEKPMETCHVAAVCAAVRLLRHSVLPQAVYFCSLAAATAVVVAVALRKSLKESEEEAKNEEKARHEEKRRRTSTAQEEAWGEGEVAWGAGGMCAAAAGALAMLVGPTTGGALALLGAAQAAALALTVDWSTVVHRSSAVNPPRLRSAGSSAEELPLLPADCIREPRRADPAGNLAEGNEAEREGSAGKGTASTASTADEAPAGADGGLQLAGAGAVAWQLAGLQLFFATGHACKFGQLHFAAAMLGFSDFNYYVQVRWIPARIPTGPIGHFAARERANRKLRHAGGNTNRVTSALRRRFTCVA